MDKMIYCNNCGSEHMASEAFCRSMNAPIAAHDKWMREHPDGKEHRSAPRNAGLVGGRGKPSTHVLERHQSPITLRDQNKPVVSQALATDKQRSFIESLLIDREIPEKSRANMRVFLDTNTLDKATASKSIAWLLKQNKKPVEFAPTVKRTYNVPDGYYALDSISGKNETVFYHVTNNRGFWNVEIQISDSFTRVNWDKAQSVLDRIEKAGTKAAMIRYGQEIGRCGHCHRTLTDDASRAAGIGPTCAAKF